MAGVLGQSAGQRPDCLLRADASLPECLQRTEAEETTGPGCPSPMSSPPQDVVATWFHADLPGARSRPQPFANPGLFSGLFSGLLPCK